MRWPQHFQSIADWMHFNEKLELSLWSSVAEVLYIAAFTSKARVDASTYRRWTDEILIQRRWLATASESPCSLQPHRPPASRQIALLHLADWVAIVGEDLFSFASRCKLAEKSSCKSILNKPCAVKLVLQAATSDANQCTCNLTWLSVLELGPICFGWMVIALADRLTVSRYSSCSSNPVVILIRAFFVFLLWERGRNNSEK